MAPVDPPGPAAGQRGAAPWAAPTLPSRWARCLADLRLACLPVTQAVDAIFVPFGWSREPRRAEPSAQAAQCARPLSRLAGVIENRTATCTGNRGVGAGGAGKTAYFPWLSVGSTLLLPRHPWICPCCPDRSTNPPAPRPRIELELRRRGRGPRIEEEFAVVGSGQRGWGATRV